MNHGQVYLAQELVEASIRISARFIRVIETCTDRGAGLRRSHWLEWIGIGTAGCFASEYARRRSA